MSSDSPAGDPATRQRILEAASRLIARRGGVDVTLAEVARAARVSRQALYLHFADRADLFLALVRHVDERQGIPAAVQRIEQAPSGVAALRAMVAMQAQLNPGIWPLARLFESLRRQDAAAEKSWQDRLDYRLQGCRRIVGRLQREGTLRPGLDAGVAADLLWQLTSLRAWEDWVLIRGWSAAEYQQRVATALLALLVDAAAH